MKVRRLLAVMALVAAGCGSSSSSPSHGSAASHGKVSVLYAGSLEAMMERDLGPAFTRSDGYSFEGVGAGSDELVSQIKGKVRQGDVFISASPEANAGLEGARNGSWVSWYITFANARLEIGYNPNSKFASDFRTMPWYKVITLPGIRVGVTDPKLDPKGKLTVETLNDAAVALHMPALAAAELVPRFSVFPEESLVGRLGAGQLDAGFFYSIEAKAQNMHTVPLTPIKKSATYTVTILKGAPDAKGAAAFVAFMLSSAGRTIMINHGLTLLSPTVVGSSAAVPESVRALLGG